MQPTELSATFGRVSRCSSVQEVLDFLRPISASDFAGRKCAAAFGMFLVANMASRPQTYFEDALALLNELSRAKTEIDVATSHDPDLARVTSQILLVAQEFVDESTIPCTEWPTTEEIARVVLDESKKYAVAE